MQLNVTIFIHSEASEFRVAKISIFLYLIICSFFTKMSYQTGAMITLSDWLSKEGELWIWLDESAI